MKIAVTGASGFIGSYLKDELSKDGFDVLALKRSPSSKVDSEQRFVLGQPFDQKQLQSIDALIHCSYDFSLVRWKDIWRVNVEGSRMLFETARKAGVSKLLFISSLSSSPTSGSFYGRGKYEVERLVEQLGKLTPETVEKVDRSLRIVLDL